MFYSLTLDSQSSIVILDLNQKVKSVIIFLLWLSTSKVLILLELFDIFFFLDVFIGYT